MEIRKGNKLYNISEHNNKWSVTSVDNKLTISIDVSKKLCQTAEELHKYILINELF